MPKRSNDFQKLIYLVQTNLSDGAEVIESKLLKDRLTKKYREVDVVIQGKVGVQPVVVSVECRDHKRAADVIWIDSMKSKHERLPTNVLLLASSSGFTKEARNVANKYGIELFTLENQYSAYIESLVGPSGSLWHKIFNLSPEKVRVQVAEIEGLAQKTVVTSPDNLLYLEDGTEFTELKQFVDLLLKSEPTINYILKNGKEEHIWFEVKWEKPTDHLDRPLYLKKLEPLILRRIEWIHVTGQCRIEIVSFSMRNAQIGSVQIAWGKSKISGRDALAVVTQVKNGVSKLSIDVKGKPSD